MRLGQIGCGRQNPPIQSAELLSTSFRIGKRQPLHCFLRNADGTTQVIPVQIGLHEAAALRPWMLVPESLVALAAEVRLTYIGVSKTNDHSRELVCSCTEDRTSINESQVSGIYMQLILK
ncbi:Hypothetical_protein [Hexamita inflata]|uniref:Hypothetical_protein n=1 Tax=Hexamita inflata TaxID=28002 RepID=A0AA86P2R8_9EUKA|nr:Hypothetical protein HINF_LOCUS16762 [Hexamita inflata]